ncbi:hypothetical protein PMEGAPL103_32750 [Priestia megaterium]
MGNAIYDKNVRITEFLFATSFWRIIVFLVEFFSYKYKKIRKIAEGIPSILINKGMID